MIGDDAIDPSSQMGQGETGLRNMDDKRKLTAPDGNLHDAVYIPVRKSDETWSSYILEDGAALRLKLVVTDVYRFEDVYDADGNPIYQIKLSTVVTVRPPDSLKKDKGHT